MTGFVQMGHIWSRAYTEYSFLSTWKMLHLNDIFEKHTAAFDSPAYAHKNDDNSGRFTSILVPDLT